MVGDDAYMAAPSGEYWFSTRRTHVQHYVQPKQLMAKPSSIFLAVWPHPLMLATINEDNPQMAIGNGMRKLNKHNPWLLFGANGVADLNGTMISNGLQQ